MLKSPINNTTQQKSELNYPTVNLLSNSYKVNFSKILQDQAYVYQYSVELLNESNIEEPQEGIEPFIKKKKRAMSATFQDYVYSGKVLWSSKYYELSQLIEGFIGKKKLALKVTYATKLDITSTNFDNSVQASAIKQLVNVMVQRGMDEKYIKGVNGRYYHSEKPALIDDKNTPLEIWPGFHISCNLTQGPQYTIHIDTCARILLSKTVLECMKAVKTKQEVKDMLIGELSIASYGKRETKKITDVDFTKNPLNFTFEDKKGNKLNMLQYYKEKYGITIQDPKQPLLVYTKGGKTEYLIPELFKLSGSEEARANFKLAKQVDQYTKFAPKLKMTKINALKEELAGTLTKHSGVMLGKAMELTGHLLKTPNRKFGPTKPNAKVNVPLESIELNDWILVYEGENYNDSEFLMDSLMKSSGQLGFKIKEPQYIELKGPKGHNDLKENLRKAITKTTQIVMLIVPNKCGTEWYETFETLCLSTYSVPCQSVKSSTLFKFKEKNPLPLAKNLLEQMAIKLGALIWTTEMPKDLPQDLMIIGADVYHKTNEKRKSCVAVCCTYNATFTKIHTETQLQASGREIMTGIGKMVSDCLKKYKEENRKLPGTIIFYRDGVGEGQMDIVLKTEVEAILQIFQTVYNGKPPKFMEVIVTKRISNKYVVKDANGNLSNPEPGTLVLDGITSHGPHNFFLTSQKVSEQQGTSTPTHYTILYDDTDIKLNTLYELTYNLCYNYYTWNGSVKVPAPIQYAHTAALKIGQVVKDPLTSQKLKGVPCLV